MSTRYLTLLTIGTLLAGCASMPRPPLKLTPKMAPGAGSFAQTAGVQMLIEGGVLKAAKVQGRAVEPINNFTAGGGDGYPKLSDHPGHVNTGLVDADVTRAFIAAGSPLKAADFTPPVTDVVRR